MAPLRMRWFRERRLGLRRLDRGRRRGGRGGFNGFGRIGWCDGFDRVDWSAFVLRLRGLQGRRFGGGRRLLPRDRLHWRLWG
jgi:hypothetical protein